MRQNAGLLNQHISGTSMPIIRSTRVSSAFCVQTWKAVWVVYRWAVRCVYCSEDVARWATSAEQYKHVDAGSTLF
jgi:hypothetical protein